MQTFVVIVAGLGALAHVYFAYTEMANWSLATVGRIAPTWLAGAPSDADHVVWARRLAFNVGAYNLVLALILAATAWLSNAAHVAAPVLGLVAAAWLAVAALAALATRVVKAFLIQGALAALLAAGIAL
ncbi:DUF1304 family protein [Sphingobium sp. PNB]|uniref:DUF1304 family protein n=1 Tax=Sphingobium sp. PNB TaxID=863934 RepID=UPI001CA41E60|nr:DUF1304 family protein [Sphingobium sp. PNB]MCB4859170.1 DUF1304 family protein [Sphingobium sp. PNB]